MATVRSEFRIGLKDETRAGVASVTRSLDTLKSKVATVGGAFAAIGTGVALAGLTQSARQVIELGDKLRDLSFATGQSVEQLSFLDFAAGQSGTSIDAISMAAQRLSKNLTDVARGGGQQAAAALRDLGLSAQELAGQDLVTQIGAVGDALAKIENPSQRAAAGAALFGRRFKELASLILEGEDGIGRLADRFVELGGVITREQADKFDAFNDSLGEMRLAVRQAGEAIATTFAPALTGIANGIANFVNGIGPALTSRFFDIKIVLLDASRAVQKSKLDFAEFFNVFGIGDTAIESTKRRIEEITKEIKLARDAQQGVIDDVLAQRQRDRASLGAPVQGSLDVENETATKSAETERLRAEKELARQQRERFQVYNSAVDDTMRQVEEEARAWEELDRRRQAAADSQRSDLQKDLDKLKELNELLGSNSAAYGEAAIDAFDRATGALVKTDDKAKELDQTFADLGATFNSAFEDAILNGEKFGTVIEGLVKDIGRLILRETVSDPLAGFVKGIFSGIGGGGGIGDFIGGLFGNAKGGLYKVAGGGGGERPIAFTAKAGEVVAVGTGMQSGGGDIQIFNIGAAPVRTESKNVNGKRQIHQYFADTAAGATAAGLLSPLGLAPAMATR